MLVLWYIVMFAGLFGMIWCAKNQQKVANAKIYAIASLVVVVISAVMVLLTYFVFEDPEEALSNANMKQFSLAELNAVAEYVDSKYEGKKIVILVSQNMLSPRKEKYSVDKLAELKSRLKKVTVEVVAVEDPQGEDPDDEGKRVEAYNQACAKCKTQQPAAVINLASFPEMGGEGLKLWTWTGKNDPKLILLSDMESTSYLQRLKDVIDFVVMNRVNAPKFDYRKDTAPEDLKAAFDFKYVIVTKDNINQLLKDKVIAGD